MLVKTCRSNVFWVFRSGRPGAEVQRQWAWLQDSALQAWCFVWALQGCYLRSARKICRFTTFTSRFSPRVEKKPTWFDSRKKHQLVQLLQFQFFCCYSDWMNPCSLDFSAVQQRFLPGLVMWAMPLAMSWRNASQRRRLQRDHVAWAGNSGSNPTSMRQHLWYNIYQIFSAIP